MFIDFSVFKSVDLSNSDNLLFLFIVFIIFAIIFFTFLFLAYKTVRTIKIFFRKSSNSNIITTDSKLDNKTDAKLMYEVGPEFKPISPNNITQNFAQNIQIENPIDEKNNNNSEIHNLKSQRDIEANLSKLKSENPENKETEIYDRIKIPRPKQYSEVGKSDGVNSFRKTAIESSRGIISPSSASRESSHAVKEILKQQPVSINNNSVNDIVESQLKHDLPHMKIEESRESDKSIFAGKESIGRRAMTYKLRLGNQEFVKAQKEVGLNLSRQQMSDLVKKYFPKYYGIDISKKEFSKQLKLLDKKQILDPSQRIQTKREIKLLKKIGGVK